MNKRKTEVSDDQIHELEAHLAGTLKPVPLPNDMILRLRERIHVPFREEIALRLRDWKRMFLVLGGVMSGLLVIITVARAFFYLVGRRNLM
jgi:isochorismate hydrolase